MESRLFTLDLPMIHEPYVVQALACWDTSTQPKGWTTYPRFMGSLHAPESGTLWDHESWMGRLPLGINLGIDDAMPRQQESHGELPVVGIVYAD
jgi:hypothetical protein